MEFRIWIIKYRVVGLGARLFALVYGLHVLVPKLRMSLHILPPNLYSSIIHIL